MSWQQKTIRQKVERIIELASENMGNDVLLAQFTDDILDLRSDLLAQIERDVLGKDEDINPWAIRLDNIQISRNELRKEQRQALKKIKEAV